MPDLLYAEIVQGRDIRIESVLTFEFHAQTVKANTVPTTEIVQPSLTRTYGQIRDSIVRVLPNPSPKPAKIHSSGRVLFSTQTREMELQCQAFQLLNIVLISDQLKILQANVNKSSIISQSIFNDPQLIKFSFFLLSEPWSRVSGDVPY